MGIKPSRLLFLSYMDGIPAPDVGGPNHVIYDFVANYFASKLTFDYLSYGVFLNDLKITLKDTQGIKLKGIKKYTYGLYYRNALFRHIVSNSYYKPFHFYKHNRFFSKQMPKKEYDIIHSHDPVSLSFTSERLSAKKIMTIHHYIPFSVDMILPIANEAIRNKVFRDLRRREIIALNLCDVITFPSKSVKEYFFEEIETEVQKDIRIIYNGIDIGKIKSLPKVNLQNIIPNIQAKYDYIIMSVASHEKFKNLQLVLETINQLKMKHNRNVLLINCGEGSLTKDLKELSIKLEIEKEVVFLGKVSNEMIIQLMKSSDIFLHLPEKAVFDLVILEAMACGLNVVASNRGGNKEIIKSCYNGYLIDLLKPEVVSNSIINSIHDHIKTNAMETIKKYSIEHYVEQYSRLYDELL